MPSGLLSKAGTFLTGLGDEHDASVEAANAYAKEKDMATGDTAADAVRHMTMAALASREYPNAGEYLMQAYETLGSGDRRAQAMDEYNNAMGLAKFMELPEEYRNSMTNEEVAEYMTSIVDQEYQYRLENDGKPSGQGPKFYEKPLYAEGYNEGGLAQYSEYMGDPNDITEEDWQTFEDSQEPITLDDFINFGLDMAPVTGEIRSAQEGLEAYEEGDYVGAALGAAGAIPGVGMVGRAAKKGGKAIMEGVDDVVEELSPAFREFFTPLKKTKDGYVPEKDGAVLRPDESVEEVLNPRLDRAMSADTAGSVMPAPGKFWNPDSRGYKGDRMSQGLRDAGVELDMEYGNYVMMGQGKPKDVTNETFENLFVTARTSEKRSTAGKNNKSVARANIYEGPSLSVAEMKANYKTNTGSTGAEVRTNLLQPERFSVKVGEDFRKLDNPIVAVETKGTGGKHYYTLDTQFVGPARMDQLTKKVRRKQEDGTYKEELPQPNLRPVTVGDVKVGKQIGTIKVGKKEHPIYDYIEVDASASAPADMGNIEKFNKGGLMAEDETGMMIIGYDEESGNPIPPGSSAENVRDDIPAMLSEGEFVLPADVVKYHGLKHIMEMREEAKEGLAAMHMEDQIKSPEPMEEEEEEYEVEGEEYSEDEETEEEREHGIEAYPTEPTEVGDEELLILLAADGGEVTSGEDTTEAPKRRLVRRMVRDPETGKMVVVYIDIATGKQIGRGTVQAELAEGKAETLDQTPERMFEQMGGVLKDDEESTAEEVISGSTSVDSPSATGSGSSGDGSTPTPMERTLANNYGFIDPTERAIGQGVASALPIPFGGPLAAWGINVNNTEAVNAARADLGLDPVDTTLGVNLDAATGMVTDQRTEGDEYDIGPFKADVTMTDQYGRLKDIDKDSSLKDRFAASKLGRFMSGKNPTTDDTEGLPYRTGSFLTPSEIAEKRASGLTQEPSGNWGYSAGAEQIGRETFADMSDDTFGSDLGLSTADKYGLSLATDRGRQEALGIASQDAELFDDNNDGKLDAGERRNMEEFYSGTSNSGSRGLGYSSDYGSSSEAAAVANDGFGSDAHFDAIDAQFNSLGSSGGSGGSSGGNYNSNTGGGTSGNGSDPGDGGGSISSTADGNDFDNFNKGGFAIKPKKRYATIKK